MPPTGRAGQLLAHDRRHSTLVTTGEDFNLSFGNWFPSGSLGAFAGPGHWNDPDMLVVGDVGWGNLHPTHLTPDEQYTHISMWCMLSAPLLIGCDLDSSIRSR